MSPGSALDHISHGIGPIGGPWLRLSVYLWKEILGFRYFSCSFRTTVISIPMIPESTLDNILGQYLARRQGPLATPLDRTGRNFSFRFVVNPISVQIFSRLEVLWIFFYVNL